MLTVGGGAAISPPGCMLLHCTLPGSDAPRGNCHKYDIGQRTILAVYLSPSRPLIKSDLSACLGGGFTILMTWDLNPRHVDWVFHLTMTRIGHVFNYANENSVIFSGGTHTQYFSMNFHRYTLCPRHRLNKRTGHPSVSDNVLRANLRLLAYIDLHKI
jgi:hypothetical protein